jgi:hypothetical protein
MDIFPVHKNEMLTIWQPGIVNNMFKTADKMFAIRFWRKNAVGT